MRKAISFAMALVMIMAFAGCGESTLSRSKTVSQGKTVNDILNEGEEKEASAQPEETPDDAQNTQPSSVDALPSDYQTVDIDLTEFNSTMVYSEVYNMLSSPEDYLGKTVRMDGTFTYAAGDDRYYFACLIADATACCSQGFEFVLKDQRTFPEEYPEVGKPITVAGVFDTYYEGDNRYCQLIDACMD